jgi:hypothetical protein
MHHQHHHPQPLATVPGSMSLPGRSHRARQHVPARSSVMFNTKGNPMSNAPTMAEAIQFFRTTVAALPQVGKPSLLTDPLHALPRAAAIVRAGLEQAGIDSGPAMAAFLLAYSSDVSVDMATRFLSAAGPAVPNTGHERLMKRTREAAAINQKHFAANDPAGLSHEQRGAIDALDAAVTKARGGKP